MAACLECGGTECICSLRKRIRLLETTLKKVLEDLDVERGHNKTPTITDGTYTLLRNVAATIK